VFESDYRRRRLMEKIAKHGIGGKLYKVIENWLSGRKQRVCNSPVTLTSWGLTRKLA